MSSSDSFKDPAQTRSHYRQALLTARLALQLGRDKSTTFSDLMPLPIFLSVLEKDTPETFIHPAIFRMRDYDKENGTAYDETMRVFSFNMHNKDRRRIVHPPEHPALPFGPNQRSV